ncbi:hypothetical protein GCM10011316_11040 [Roseibium aquae]|uniref:Cysteine rich repeat protein n=1 Tax=Roseibium aquae TaxID=1323746 RepID=A0A916TEQ0_9HYPH|nr:hypothetical protein [Roseibium aquae]GGB40788.1 hypothetical protein GCM10011316_11040 [Roseibium aquae]
MLRLFIAATAALWLGLAGSAMAQTVGFADAIKILAASCGADIDKYCKSATLANNGIGQCLNENASKVSAQCNTDRVRVAALLEARFAAQAAVFQVCERPARQYCPGVKPGAGHVLKCLLKAERVVGDKCNTAIDLAGYR